MELLQVSPSALLTLPAFVLAIGLLIAVHEYGHYRVAVACGVRVLRFSIGMGRPLWRHQANPQATEFVLGVWPIGGYVQMLDEREGPVPPHERHRAFNTQSLARRASIVAAGPIANLLLAVVLYTLVGWIGFEQPAPVLAAPPENSLAANATLRAADRVVSARAGDGEWEPIPSYERLRWVLTQSALKAQDLELQVKAGDRELLRTLRLPLASLQPDQLGPHWLESAGFVGVYSRPVLGEVLPEGAAARAGLKAGDEVLAVQGRFIEDALQLRQIIRQSVQPDGRVVPQRWRVLRDGQVSEFTVHPTVAQDGGHSVGRIGAFVGAAPEMVQVRYDVFAALVRAVGQTAEMSTLTLTMLGKVFTGQASVKNISGPLTIADYAGKSAHVGLVPYLMFLALISVSLGVLNLLPLPVLDGGHLMYYLWEALTGAPVSLAWMQRFQQGGMAVLVVLMSLALFNDLNRLLG
ncbi:MAG: RIP metalloprotease RseP [Rhodoferax sp.]